MLGTQRKALMPIIILALAMISTALGYARSPLLSLRQLWVWPSSRPFR